MENSVGDLETSRSIFERQYPNFEMLDARIASALRKTLRGDDVHFFDTRWDEAMMSTKDFDTRWDESMMSTEDVPSDGILGRLFNMRTRESEQVKSVFALYEQDTDRKICCQATRDFLNHGKEVSRQEDGDSQFEARNERTVTGAPVKCRSRVKSAWR